MRFSASCWLLLVGLVPSPLPALAAQAALPLAVAEPSTDVATARRLLAAESASDLRALSWSVIERLAREGEDPLAAQLAAAKWRHEPAAEFIIEAGTTGDPAVQLRVLRTLRTHAGREGWASAGNTPLSPRDAGSSGWQVSGLEKTITELERWITEPNLRYFAPDVITTLDYNFGVGPDSPLYPLAAIYRARMLLWVTTNAISGPERAGVIQKAIGLLRFARAVLPENRIVRMYLGEAYSPEKIYTAPATAPAWAVSQREGLERVADIVEWWIDHRLQEDGSFGGGWGDDCEMWRVWVPVLIGFESPKISRAQRFFSRSILAQPHLSGGYMTRKMTDVEHSAEDTADSITPMMHIDPNNPEWERRVLRLVDLMENLWTGRNQRGLLQFKSTYFNAERVDLRINLACDTAYHPRALQPALLYWQRTGDPRLTRIFADWMSTWVAAAASDERGKPRGVLPSAIHWPDGQVGGTGPEWWDPRNHSQRELFQFPSALGMLTQTLLLTHVMTAEDAFLEPIRSMARMRQQYLRQRGAHAVEAKPGSETWCAERMGFLSTVLGKYRLVTGSTEFDDLLRAEKKGHANFLFFGESRGMEDDLHRTAEALRINFPGYTSEVRYTDRVVRFPRILGAHGPRYPEPDTDLLYQTSTGDPGGVGYFPLNAVRWLTPSRDIAALVTRAGTAEFFAELFHFGSEPRAMAAQFFRLKPGNYRLSVRVKNDKSARLAPIHFTVQSGAPARIAFQLPAQETCILEVSAN